MSVFAFSLALQAVAATNQWISIPAGEYKPLFTASEADPKGLINLDQNVTGPKTMTQVSSFEVNADPVSNKDFLAFVRTHPDWRRDRAKAIFSDKNYLRHWSSPTQIGKRGLESEPVVNVSWFAANAFCEARGARLPTNDEWEYISSQDDPARRDEVIMQWYSKPANEKSGSSKRTFIGRRGVRNMYGQIWEWTLDFNSAMVTGESREDTSLSRSMFCGAGSIGSTNPTAYATFMRFAFRSSLKGNYAQPTLGFRCARSKHESEKQK